jgi:hypothetical protein
LRFVRIGVVYLFIGALLGLSRHQSRGQGPSVAQVKAKDSALAAHG